MKETRPLTIFCDIDGTLVEHIPPTIASLPETKLKILPGTIEKLLEWDSKGYNIILTSGRKESLRKITEKQLSEAGIFYDQLVMGIGGGYRILINDKKNNNLDNTAVAICVDRNSGLSKINL